MKMIYIGAMPGGNVRCYDGHYVPFVRNQPVEIPIAEASDLLQSGDWQQAGRAEKENTDS